MDNETSSHRGIREPMNSVDLGNPQRLENSSSSDAHNVSETVIVIRSEQEQEAVCVGGENRNLDPNGNSNADVIVLGCSEEGERKIKDSKEENQSCAIDVNVKLGENFEWERERVCRICHLSPDPSPETELPPPPPPPPPPPTTTTSASAMTPVDCGLIQLGCGCKDELGIVHAYCAEAWFKLKGNRQCEICGETAKNITVVGDNRLAEDSNESRFAGSEINFSERSVGCLRGQPFCNFLMACLVIAFVLPWFFRVNMF